MKAWDVLHTDKVKLKASLEHLEETLLLVDSERQVLEARASKLQSDINFINKILGE